MIKRFRKRPVEVEAIQWTGANASEVKAFVGHRETGESRFLLPEEITGAWEHAHVYDELHSTWVGVYTGQWVVKGVNGEFYPIADDVLAETYDKADAATEMVTIRGNVYEVEEWDLRDPGCTPGETWTWTLYATQVEAGR